MPRINRPDALGYLQQTNLDLDNNFALRSHETDGTRRAFARIDASDRVTVGNDSLPLRLLSSTGAELQTTTVAGAPSAGTAARIFYVSNGDAGSPCLAVDNGSNWLRVALGTAISAS